MASARSLHTFNRSKSWIVIKETDWTRRPQETNRGIGQDEGCENSGLQPLAACARRPTLGVRAAPAMPIKLAKTRKQTKLKLSDLTSLNLTFFSAHENNQSKLSGYLSAAVPCCCLSLLFVDVHRAGASNSESKVIQVPVKNRPCNCCWKTNFTSSTNMPFQSLTCSKNVKPVPQNFTSTKLLK